MRSCGISLALLFGAALALGCGRDLEPPRPGRATIPVVTFTRVIEELSAARAEVLPDSAAYGRRRAEILARHGVTAEDLMRFVEVHGWDDERLAPVYRQVGTRLDSLMQERIRAGAGRADRFPATLPEDEPVRFGPQGLQPRTGAADTAAPTEAGAPGDTSIAVPPPGIPPDTVPR